MKTHDLIAVGIGPANLSLAIAVEEYNQKNPVGVQAVFLEKKSNFSWHPDMLIPGSKLQNSFLKDLVTLRNPSSQYSFLHYLFEKKRLANFINLRVFLPTRQEFADYFSWVADKLQQRLHYQREVIAITPSKEKVVRHLEITTHDPENGTQYQYRTRHLVLALGGTPAIPAGVKIPLTHPRLIHTSHFLQKLAALKHEPNKAYQFMIIGSGQSSAEIMLHLYKNFPQTKITVVFRQFAFKPVDSTPFVNELYDSEKVDQFYHGLPAFRKFIAQKHNDTNYAVIDPKLIEEIYRIQYEEKVSGIKRLHLLSLNSLQAATVSQHGLEVILRDRFTDVSHNHYCDALFLATGYHEANIKELLAPLHSHLCFDENQQLITERSYKIKSSSSLQAGIFTQGTNEYSHGISDRALAILPIRNQEIFEKILTLLPDKANNQPMYKTGS